MTNFTSNTYTLKREILSFLNKISRRLSKPDSCLLTDIVDQLHEPSKKVNSVERLTRHLNKGTPKDSLISYLQTIRKWTPDQPVIHIDDSDVIKPNGYKFEALRRVRDGSKSTSTKNVYEKGYHVTEASVMTTNSHPVSIYSKIHSSNENNFTSINNVTFEAIERGKATFVIDRGYDDNKMFLKLDEMNQDYVIRLTAKRKLFFHNCHRASKPS